MRLLLALAPALALAACGSSKEEELTVELAQAKAAASEEAAARKAAERDASALRAKAQDAALADFYSGDGNSDEEANPAPHPEPGEPGSEDIAGPEGVPVPHDPPAGA